MSTKETPPEFADLRKELKVPLNEICRVIVHNRTRQADQISIGGGCKFFYQDGNGNITGDWSDLHPSVDVPTGLDLVFQSNNGCVRKIRIAIEVKAASESQSAWIYGEREVLPTQCAIECNFTLKPKSAISRDTRLLIDMLELVFD